MAGRRSGWCRSWRLRARPLAAGRQPQGLVGVPAACAARVVMDRTQLPPSVEDDPGDVTGSPRPELLWTKLERRPLELACFPGPASSRCSNPACRPSCAWSPRRPGRARPPCSPNGGPWPVGAGWPGCRWKRRQRPHPVLELSGGGVADRRAGGGHRGPGGAGWPQRGAGAGGGAVAGQRPGHGGGAAGADPGRPPPDHRRHLPPDPGRFLDHLPAEVHVVLSTRLDPPLPLARMRARGSWPSCGWASCSSPARKPPSC